MESDYNLGLQLMLVGMLSVFMILGIVVALGRTLIFFVNKYGAVPIHHQPIKRGIPKENIVVLSSVVDIVTQGQGVIKSIKKL